MTLHCSGCSNIAVIDDNSCDLPKGWRVVPVSDDNADKFACSDACDRRAQRGVLLARVGIVLG